MSGGSPIDFKDIVNAANARAFELASHLLPNGRRSSDRRHWETNNLGDTPTAHGGYSLKVDITGPYTGLWRDHATGEGGDLVDLARERLFGGDKGKAVQWLKSFLGLDGQDPSRLEKIRYQAQQRAIADEEAARREAEAKRRGARALWLSGVPIAGTPAARYLEARALVANEGYWPGSLRFHEEVWNRDAGVKLPAMVATMVLPDGTHVATHRTWLARDRDRRWVKAEDGDVGVPRKSSKKVLGKCGGAFIPISKGASAKSMGALAVPEPVYVCEGVENAMTVALIRPGFRVVASYSVDNFGAILFPPLIDRIVFCADRDKPRDDGRRSAIEALEAAIAKHQARGKHVQLVYPPIGFKDFNDWLQAEVERAKREGRDVGPIPGMAA